MATKVIYSMSIALSSIQTVGTHHLRLVTHDGDGDGDGDGINGDILISAKRNFIFLELSIRMPIFRDKMSSPPKTHTLFHRGMIRIHMDGL